MLRGSLFFCKEGSFSEVRERRREGIVKPRAWGIPFSPFFVFVPFVEPSSGPFGSGIYLSLRCRLKRNRSS